MTHDRDLERLLATVALQANAKLVEVRKTNHGHIKARFDRGPLVFTSSTPSEWRTTKNLKAQARRALR